MRSFIKHNFLGDERGGDALAFYFYNMLNLTSTNITFADNRAEQKNAQLLNCNFVRNSGAMNSGTFQLSVSEPFFVISTAGESKNCAFIQNEVNGLGIYDIFLYQNNLTISFLSR